MPDEDKHSRTEKPTTRRKKEARREGTVARTPEVVSWSVVLVGTFMAEHTLTAMTAMTQNLMVKVGQAMSTPSVPGDIGLALWALEQGAVAVAPAILTVMFVALGVNLAQTRGLVTFKPLKPTFSRLNPKNGIKRVVSPKSLWEVGKQIVRVALLSVIAINFVTGLLPLVTGSGPLTVTAVAGLVGSRAVSLAREVAEISLVLAALDYIVQFRRTANQLKMSKQAIKEESKASDGNPYVRGAMRRRQRQMARNRMIAAVGKADAVVVNPTHFAVAIRYVRGRGAPRVVAKGSDFLALRIKEEAALHRVPIVEDPPLARALYVICELDHEIPGELYEAVARLLSFIYSLKSQARGASRVDGAPLKPATPLLGANDPLARAGDGLLALDGATGDDEDDEVGTATAGGARAAKAKAADRA